MRETAVLGGGRFWAFQAIFQQLQGVEYVFAGYAGGHVPHPTAEQVRAGSTGHAEVVKVAFDPRVISFRDLLHVFFAFHDPATPDRQGPDVGAQYRSVVFAASPEQAQVAQDLVRELGEEGLFPTKILTQVSPLAEFWVAEPDQQDYFQRHASDPYCRLHVAPKVARFRRACADKLKPTRPSWSAAASPSTR